MVEDLNGGEGVGRKWRHEGENEDDTTEIFGVVKRQKPLALMTREGSNFYNIKFWDSSRNNTDRRHERVFGYKTLNTKEAQEALKSL